MPLEPGDNITLTFGMNGIVGPCSLPEYPQWYRNDTIIPGANNLTYVATKGGTYKIADQAPGQTPHFNSFSIKVIYNSIDDFNFIIDTNKSLPINPGDSITMTLVPTTITNDSTFAYGWYRNDTAIYGANKKSFTAKQEGIYKIEFRVFQGQLGSGGVYFSTYTATFNPTNVKNIDPNGNLIYFYPNPNDGIFNVFMDNVMLNQQYDILVYDMFGKIVQKEKLTIENTTINISTKDKGIYFIKVVDKNRQVKADKVIYR